MSVNNTAPYKNVLTHGFVLDQKGQKMSKSIGNVVNPDEIVQKYGSDVLRLWVASSNYKQDVNIGPEIIKQIAENKRKIRNTLRFILGNLNGFDAEMKAEFRWIDRLMLAKLEIFQDACREAFESYDFSTVTQSLNRFCAHDLSAFYFEILKDRLYTEPLDSPLRQGAQAVLNRILTVLLDTITPIMPILAEEIRSSLEKPSINVIDSQLASMELDWIQERRADFMEWFNTSGKRDLQVKSTFQLDLSIDLPAKEFNVLSSEELREIFGVASVLIHAGEQFAISSIKASDRLKCPRCWTFDSLSEDELCPRCITQTRSIEELKEIKL